MNEFYDEDFTKRNSKPMVDLTYYTQKNRGSQRRSIQIFTPKLNLKNEINHNNPQEMFNASNNINLILSKNLVSIYKENKQEISKKPLYKNINCLLKKNNNSNIYLYKKMFDYKNNNNRNSVNNNILYNNKKKSLFKSLSGKITRINKHIKSKKYLTNYDSFIHLEELQKHLENSKIKYNYQTASPASGKKINKYIKDLGLDQIKEIKSGSINNHSKNKKKSYRYDSFGKNGNEIKKILKENKAQKKRSNSEFVGQTPNFKSNLIYKNKKRSFANSNNKNNNIKPNLNTGRYSLKSNFNLNKLNNNFKINPNMNSNTNKKKKPYRHSIFVISPKREMKIPELNKTLIAHQMETIKKELESFEKNEINEIKSTIEKNKNNNLRRISVKPKLNSNKLDKEDLSRRESNKTEHNESQTNKKLDERFQKKYRKLFICKNLYDSLDDEEIIEEGKSYNCYISPNSFIVYLLDAIILIASNIELYYLPIYISYHITSYNIYTNIFNTIIFDIIDILYILDLLSGFFRAYYNFEEVLVKKPHYIFWHYLTGWFIFDFIEAIPFFTVLDYQMIKLRDKSINPIDGTIHLFNFGLNNKNFALTFLKLIKIFKIFSNNSALTEVKKILDNNQFFYEWKGIFFSILIIFSTLHFSTCFFIFIGKIKFQGWILNNNLQDKSFMNIYIASLYYQMTTLTTVGYGDISATNDLEKFYGIFVLIVGTCAYSWILTNISNYIKKNNEKFIDFEEKMKVLNEIKLEYSNFGQDLYNRIARYLNYNKSEYKCNLKFILESLPSSIQNNLIIEIYKPIIKNFQFFKSFENSDFFVKIVTSLKSVLTLKDDILIEEGQSIEDIIFIKNGVLTLEILIDLNMPKKSIESHLKTTGMECFKNISNRKFSMLMNLSTLNKIYQPEFSKKIFEEDPTNKKEIKIIDLRKNEHFGDILMILNEKSPLTVKVKSKKAELFLLEKTQAIEISNRYPNIWKRIVNRSLHNMNQIKNIIKKKVLLFSEIYNIEINPNLKHRYLKNEKIIINNLLTDLDKKDQKTKNSIIETILEEDENFAINNITGLSEKNLNNHSSKEKSKNIGTLERFHNNSSAKHNTKKKVVNFKQDLTDQTNLVADKKNEKHMNEKTFKKKILKNANKNKVHFKEDINKEINNNIDINDYKNKIIMPKKESDKSNKINQINNYNYSINIYSPKVEIPLNQINNIENKISIKYRKEEKEDKEEMNNSSNLGKINNEFSFNNDFSIDIKENNILMNNLDENSNILFTNLNLKSNDINYNNINDKHHKNIIELFESKKIDKFLNKIEKTEIKTDDKISIKSVSSDKSKINLKNKDIDNIITKKSRFISLSTSPSISFSLNSSYENINVISNYKYNTDTELREKTKKFILEQINTSEKKDNKITIHTVVNNNKLTTLTTNLKLNNKNNLLRKKSEDISNSRKNLNKNLNINLRPLTKRSFCEEVQSKFTTHIENNDILDKIGEGNDDNFSRTIYGKSRKSLNKIRKYLPDDEKDNTFYNKIRRIKTMKKREINKQDEYANIGKKDTKMSYNRLISKNIEKNQKNLNNPEEYFEGFFNNIIFNNSKVDNILGDNVIKKKETFQKSDIE